MGSTRGRAQRDIMKMMMSDYEVELINDCMREFYVTFPGPKDTPYAGGKWKIRVELPDSYPYKSPSIGFLNTIFHPNIDEKSGSVCLDVINQTWSPMYDMVNIFEVFLPQLLAYPNPSDPLNTDAATLLLREPLAYDKKVKEYVRRHAMRQDQSVAGDELDDEDEMSSIESENDDEEMED